MAENRIEKRKGSETDTETAAEQNLRRKQQGAQGAGKDGSMDESAKPDEGRQPPEQRSGRG